MRPLSATFGSGRDMGFEAIPADVASGRGSSSVSAEVNAFETVLEEIMELSFTVNKHCIATHHFTEQSKTHISVITLLDVYRNKYVFDTIHGGARLIPVALQVPDWRGGCASGEMPRVMKQESWCETLRQAGFGMARTSISGIRKNTSPVAAADTTISGAN
jgi:hypothetical protein